MYFTEFTTLSGIRLLQEYIQPNLERRHNRVDKRRDDEIALLHPQVILHLENLGWETEHHVRLPSGSIIDVVAKEYPITYVIECKPKLNKEKLYSAIGQVLCYCAEYRNDSIPGIATYSTSISKYSRQVCRKLGIELFEIEKE